MGKSAGKIMPLPRGAYDENATYNILDMVTLDNKLWIATRSGVTGITPSKTATEWMMAVDGTTDVKALETEVDAKFASIDEQFLAKDTQISGLNTRVTAAEGSITELDGKFVFDDAPTEGSTKLITSGAVYNTLHSSRDTMENDGTGELIKSDIGVYGNTGVRIVSTATQVLSGMDRDIIGEFRADYGSPSMICRHQYRSGGNTKYSSLGVSETDIDMTISKNDSEGRTYFRFYSDNMSTQDDSSYDIGSSSRKFKDIYAQNGTIKTSDRNEKKDILELDPETNRKFIAGLKPVSYKFINNTSERTHYGLIAQDVEDLLNEIGINPTDFAGFIKSPKLDEDGTIIEGKYIYALRYDEFIAPLIKMCQNLQNEVDELKARLGGE